MAPLTQFLAVIEATVARIAGSPIVSRVVSPLDVLRKLKPDRFEDIIAVGALYRLLSRVRAVLHECVSKNLNRPENEPA